MADANGSTQGEAPEGADGKESSGTQQQLSLEQALQKITTLETEVADGRKLIEKLRKFEKENKERAERGEAETGKYKDLYETERAKHEQYVRDATIDGVLKDTLVAAGAKSIPTVLKLIDRSQVSLNDDGSVDPKTVQKHVDALKASDAYLFGDAPQEPGATKSVAVPSRHRAGSGDPAPGYEQEIRSAKSHVEIEAVMRKYGKLPK